MLLVTTENVSKKGVTDKRMKSELRGIDMLLGHKYFETAIDNLVSSYKLELCGNNSTKMCFITTHWDHTILVPQTQVNNSVNENTFQLLNENSNLQKIS